MPNGRREWDRIKSDDVWSEQEKIEVQRSLDIVQEVLLRSSDYGLKTSLTMHDDLDFLQHSIMLPCKSDNLSTLKILGSSTSSRLQCLHTLTLWQMTHTLWCPWSTMATMCHWSMRDQCCQLASLPAASL